MDYETNKMNQDRNMNTNVNKNKLEPRVNSN